ncbi:MAG: polyprenyl synthetase, partial [Proteobacteria bacterium]|nr:polyprenyl synthetase [Pseudomonadota bacterium]
ADPAARSALARFGLHVGSAHALRSEAEDAARFGVADAQARAQAEIEAARAVADGLALANAAALGVVVEG